MKNLPEVLQDRKNASSVSKCCLVWPNKFLCFLACSHESDTVRVNHLWELEDDYAENLRERIANVWDQMKISNNDKDPNLMQVLRKAFRADICRTIMWHLFLALVTVIELVPVLFFLLTALKDFGNAHLSSKDSCYNSCPVQFRTVLGLSLTLFVLECFRAYCQAQAWYVFAANCAKE